MIELRRDSQIFGHTVSVWNGTVGHSTKQRWKTKQGIEKGRSWDKNKATATSCSTSMVLLCSALVYLGVAAQNNTAICKLVIRTNLFAKCEIGEYKALECAE